MPLTQTKSSLHALPLQQGWFAFPHGTQHCAADGGAGSIVDTLGSAPPHPTKPAGTGAVCALTHIRLLLSHCEPEQHGSEAPPHSMQWPKKHTVPESLQESPVQQG